VLKDWDELFKEVKKKAYVKSLCKFLRNEYASHIVYPSQEKILEAFKLTSPKTLKVVIIGQDPYHNPDQAMGLSFSVAKGVKLPPSLLNIYKEIEDDLGIEMNRLNGDLTPWAKQGILLLNTYLTVRSDSALSHRRKEYELFMKDVMAYLDSLSTPIAFMLWGNFAKAYQKDIHSKKHLILSASHPSPLALARGGWFKMHLFSKCNSFLVANGLTPIDWKIE